MCKRKKLSMDREWVEVVMYTGSFPIFSYAVDSWQVITAGATILLLLVKTTLASVQKGRGYGEGKREHR